MTKREKQWQFEDDCRTLESRAVLMSDEKRYAAAQEWLKKKTENLNKIANLPNLTEALFGKKSNKKE